MSPRFLTPALLLRKSDEELVSLAARGYDAAFAAIVLRHRGHLLRHCRTLLRDQRAEDAVQQTFMRALQAMRNGTEVRDLRPWLHRIARNVALTELGGGKWEHAELSEEWEDPRRSEEYEHRANLRDALVAIEALPDRQRTALLRSAAGLTPAAIAHELGVTSVAARQLVHRARVSVRAAVRVICPPPLVWLMRRMATTWERVPRAAGVPAGAAPVASKIALVVVASATVAAPVTVIRGVLGHPHHPRHAHRVLARTAQPVLTSASLPPATVTRAPSPLPAAAPEPKPTASPPPRAARTVHRARPTVQSVGVSAISPDGAAVGGGSGPGGSGPGGAGPSGQSAHAAAAGGSSAGGSLGPISSASASAPTYPAASGSSSPVSSASSSASGSAGGGGAPAP